MLGGGSERLRIANTQNERQKLTKTQDLNGGGAAAGKRETERKERGLYLFLCFVLFISDSCLLHVVQRLGKHHDIAKEVVNIPTLGTPEEMAQFISHLGMAPRGSS